MARCSLPEFAILWQRHESTYLRVFFQALHALSDEEKIIGDENTISKTLCPILNYFCFVGSRLLNKEIRTPVWDGPITPVSEDEMALGSHPKRPDFTCKLCNPYATSAEEHEISFHIECKCIGSPTSPSWILNKNYVSNGIKRFDSFEHEYGKRAPSGLMIGYIIDMDPETILHEINSYQARKCPQNKVITFDSFQEQVNSTCQFLQRLNVKPKDFKLTHMWADFRNNYQKQ